MEPAGYIVLTHVFHKEGRKWVADCRELGTSTFGRSLGEAEKRLKDAVLCHLNTLEEVGERGRFFRENNIQFHSEKPRNINVRISPNEDEFIMPKVQRVPVNAH